MTYRAPCSPPLRSGRAVQPKANPLAPFGAEIVGVDLKEAIEPSLASLLRLALGRYQVLVLRNQFLEPAHQEALTRALGNLEPSIASRPMSHKVGGFSNVLRLSNEPGSPTVDYGTNWHSDGLHYAIVPHGATVLACVECPNGRAETWFADQYAAYQRLPESLQSRAFALRWILPDVLHSEVPRGRSYCQPLARVHGLTNRPYLYCTPVARRILGLSDALSDEILDCVRTSQISENNVYRHVWRSGDVVVWENATLLHKRGDAADFSDHGPRVMHRSVTQGEFAATDCSAHE